MQISNTVKGDWKASDYVVAEDSFCREMHDVGFEGLQPTWGEKSRAWIMSTNWTEGEAETFFQSVSLQTRVMMPGDNWQNRNDVEIDMRSGLLSIDGARTRGLRR